MTAVELDPVFPVPLIAALVSAAALVTIVLALRGGSVRPAWMRFPLVLLRLGVLTGLAWVLLNPVKPIPRPAEDTAAMILLDRSASMKLPTEGNATRWSEACDWVAAARRAAADKGLEQPAVATFAAGIEPLETGADAGSLRPDGTETRLANCLLDQMRHQDARSPRQIIVVSDGRTQDKGDIQQALAAAAGADVSVSTKLVGTDVPPRNSWITSVDAPRTVLPRGSGTVQVKVGATGMDPDATQQLVIRERGGKELVSARVRPGVDPPGDLTFPVGLRTCTYEAELVPAADEVDLSDNRFVFTIEVTSSKLRVLFVEGTHVKRSVGTNGYWWNDMELMTRAWDASGEIEYECLTPYSEYNDRPNLVGVTFFNGEMKLDPSKTFPRTVEELHRFDVMLISDVPVGNFNEEQMQWVVDWVSERGGGFLMGGGYTTFDAGNYDQTPWERIIPVDMLTYGAGFMEKTFPIRIPDSVKHHPLWRISEDPVENDRILATHPKFTGMNRVKRAKPGAVVLATRADVAGDEPAIAAQNYGRGRSIAFLPDPNGGWAKFYVSWGPPGGPRMGPQTELGHGGGFKFNANAAAAASGEAPPHPSPYYGQYWVNLVKWLGANSIRWHRERMAGRVNAVAAVPGKVLPVTAEVLSVNRLNDLLALDVGARIAMEGSTRVRLRYDRDAREFIGDVPVPAGIEGDELRVLFDANTENASLSDSANLGIRRGNLEFSDSKPDPEFMKQLAEAANGKVLATPEDAVNWLLKDQENRRVKSTSPRKEPVWPAWPLLGGLIGLLCMEWALRRRATSWVGAASVALLCFFPTPGRGAQDTASLIEQLGADKVRLRDEAQEKLAKIPGIRPAIERAAKEATSEEARLRAANLLQEIAKTRWVEVFSEQAHPQNSGANPGTIVVNPKLNQLFTRSNDGIREWSLPDLKQGRLRGQPIPNSWAWETVLMLNPLVVSPSSGTLVSVGMGQNLVFSDLRNPIGTETEWNGSHPFPASSGNEGMLHKGPIVWLAFTPKGDQLVYSDPGTHLVFKPYPKGGTPRVVSTGSYAMNFAFAPDGQNLIVATDPGGEPDYLQVRDASGEKLKQSIATTNRINSMKFNRSGDLLLASSRHGGVYLWKYGNDRLSDQRTITILPGDTGEALFSPDERSVIVACMSPGSGISEWDLGTGKPVWQPEPADYGVRSLTFLPDGRLAGLCTDMRLRVWKLNE